MRDMILGDAPAFGWIVDRLRHAEAAAKQGLLSAASSELIPPFSNTADPSRPPPIRRSAGSGSFP